MTRRYVMKVLIILLIAMCIVMPAVAVELEEVYLGTVTKADNTSGALDVKITAQWDGKQFAPVNSVTIQGTSTFDVLFDNIKQGDEVVGTLMGGEQWIAVGLVGAPQSTEKNVLWMVGDPNTMVAPFIGNYRVTYTADPKCDSCVGSVCYANSVNVTATSIGYTSGREYIVSEVGTETLRPAESWDALGTGNQQYLDILFIKGEAPASACPESGMIVGPQPVSTFFIKVMSVTSAVPTTEETTAVPATLPETETPVPATLPETEATTAAPTATPIPGFGIMLAVLGCAAAMLVIRR